MRLEGKSIKSILKFAHQVYNENFEYYHLQKHFTNHLTLTGKEVRNKDIIIEWLGRLFLDKLKDAKRIEIEA
jgi:hypothetical protein